MKKIAFIAASLFTLISPPSMAGTSAQVEYGTVQESHIITQASTSSHQGSRPLRTIGAAALGATVGNQFGGGAGKTIATTVGAVAGAEASRRRQSEQGTTSGKQTVELLIKTQAGKQLSVVQDNDPALIFNKGDKVRILTSGSDTSVDKSV
ncbi:outer membrane lipoprotein [Aeromonas tecta]|uniref:outer membrane lipoprotein n=1 Tax=Aeromonas tecta TaxID=324617 RepID=UPI00068235DF|nr:hypothetical protein [Aeromonas tecta]